MINQTKTMIASKFYENYSALNDSEKEKFAIACAKLSANNFIYGQRGHDDNLYHTILSFKKTIEGYFALMNADLIHDDNYKIFFLKSNVIGTRARLKKLETVLLLIMAKLYSTKSLEVSTGSGVEVSVATQELVDEVNKTRIFSKPLFKGDLSNAMKTLKKYKVIDVGSTDIVNIESFNILPTILYIVTSQDLEDIENKLKGLSLLDELDEDMEDDDNETSED